MSRLGRSLLLAVLALAGCGGTCDDLWYVDLDGDGFGDPIRAYAACRQPEGMVANGRDCDDLDAAAHPDAHERCNGLDDDCDGLVDEEHTTRWYYDADGDGYGDPFEPLDTCAPPRGYSIDGGDCDDADDAVHPDSPELCNGIDDDCNGTVDDEPVNPFYWYRDADGDGFGDPGVVALRCDPPPGYVADTGDCDDGDKDVHPFVVESCDHLPGVDDDCDGVIDEGCDTGP